MSPVQGAVGSSGQPPSWGPLWLRGSQDRTWPGQTYVSVGREWEHTLRGGRSGHPTTRLGKQVLLEQEGVGRRTPGSGVPPALASTTPVSPVLGVNTLPRFLSWSEP